ncbi:MAG: ornithine cyclodeaminase family protein [Planctomycetaceae bacterium]|nr:ornithine cyclodeaminase family protein [Planctomycetaceae bacterium]
MPALFLTEQDVQSLVDMSTAVDVVQEAFLQWADGKAMNVARRRAKAPGIMLHSLSAGAEYLGYVGWKNYTTTHDAARFHVAIYNNTTGEMAAFIEADYLGQLRTGAASGVATAAMARPESRTVGLFGTGKQAKTQLEAMCEVRKIDYVEVYSRDENRREQFADEMSERLGVEIEPSPYPSDVVAEKDIVITATTSKEPLFSGNELSEGTHLNLIGSNHLRKTEVDLMTIRQADVIVCDSIEQCRLEAGDFVTALEAGVTEWSLMHELKDVVAGKVTGRATEESITLFKSVGLGLEDVALAAEILKRATEQGVGEELPF